MNRTGLILAVALALLPLSACEDDSGKPPTPPRDPRAILIPDEMDLEEASFEAVPGDTLVLSVFFPLPPLTRTVTFHSEQTPLLIIGDKSLPLVTGTGGFPFLRFEGPKTGTRVQGVAFSGGVPAIRVTGSGEMEIAGCRFTGGTAQVATEGTALTVRVTECMLLEAGYFGIDGGGSSRVVATRNSILRAGDCGIRLTGSAQGDVVANIIWKSANYGIACLDGAALTAQSGCNDVFENVNGPYAGCVAPESDFGLDPQFCDVLNGIYTLASVSPCAEDNSGGCGWIGAQKLGCDFPPDATGRAILPRGSR